MAEMVDVVDEDDRVVGRVDRAEMRARNLLHRAVYVLVTNDAGALFAHRRTDTKDVYPGYWDVTIGGVVASGEDYVTAAHRELHEELGIERVELRDLGAFSYEDPSTRVRGRVFVAVVSGPLTLQSEEIVAGAFVPLAEATRIVTQERCCPDAAAAYRAHRDALDRGGRSVT
jgi:isopentenyldiphosphate isomerase